MAKGTSRRRTIRKASPARQTAATRLSSLALHRAPASAFRNAPKRLVDATRMIDSTHSASVAPKVGKTSRKRRQSATARQAVASPTPLHASRDGAPDSGPEAGAASSGEAMPPRSTAAPSTAPPATRPKPHARAASCRRSSNPARATPNAAIPPTVSRKGERECSTSFGFRPPRGLVSGAGGVAPSTRFSPVTPSRPRRPARNNHRPRESHPASAARRASRPGRSSEPCAHTEACRCRRRRRGSGRARAGLPPTRRR